MYTVDVIMQHHPPKEQFCGNSQEFFTKNPVKMTTAIFLGISRNPFRGTRSEEFLVPHSEEILQN